MVKLLIVLASLNAVLAATLGAFGAHALKGRLSEDMLNVFQTGVQYHFYHALGLFAVAFVAAQFPDSTLVKWSGWTMQAGIVLFSGSLYVLSVSGVRWLGAITPLGGLGLIAAWCLLAIAVLKN